MVSCEDATFSVYETVIHLYEMEILYIFHTFYDLKKALTVSSTDDWILATLRIVDFSHTLKCGGIVSAVYSHTSISSPETPFL